ncbi:hypothetical protein SAMN06265379_104285 [Saccharicrinis carchari]|uniref:Uncharacterized protein n=1 Tax=Saccharicrinis carchari TaxID=1168039 RepID=A0A521D641_SACCC|nr:hypothetical protein SAMN06265379_104285 [Saccharicrinis carchari]
MKISFLTECKLNSVRCLFCVFKLTHIFSLNQFLKAYSGSDHVLSRVAEVRAANAAARINQS